MANVSQAQKRYYDNLKANDPRSYRMAADFAKRLANGDPRARAALKKLTLRASHDARAREALKALAVVCKFEHWNSAIFAGGLPAVAHGLVSGGGKVIKFALSPVAWAGNTAGQGFKWAGSQLQRLSHAI